MAHSLTSLSHSSSPSSSSFSIRSLVPTRIQSAPTTTQYPKRHRLLGYKGRQRSLSLRSSQDEVSVVDPPPPPPPPEEGELSFELLPYLKFKLLVGRLPFRKFWYILIKFSIFECGSEFLLAYIVICDVGLEWKVFNFKPQAQIRGYHSHLEL